MTVRLLFVDEGSYHHEDVQVPAEAIEDYERLIDFLREDPAVLKQVYVDVERLCAAHLLSSEAAAAST
ncbi:MAG: hypothetical protein D6701_07965 [Gemmatimonadetes bacterium]|nr:MAG: hypothetical protein D6701_07965 [Gemmatimonadota bacterium]